MLRLETHQGMNCPVVGLEWTSSHQCTSSGWARSNRFADEHPPCPSRFFFSPPLCLEILYLPPPTYPLLPTTYQAQPPLLPPPSYLPPTNPTPPSLHRQSSRDLKQLWSGSWSCGCGAGAGAAGAGLVGVGVGPTRPRKGKMLTFFFHFFCLFCLKKAWEVFFFLAYLLVAECFAAPLSCGFHVSSL